MYLKRLNTLSYLSDKQTNQSRNAKLLILVRNRVIQIVHYILRIDDLRAGQNSHYICHLTVSEVVVEKQVTQNHITHTSHLTCVMLRVEI